MVARSAQRAVSAAACVTRSHDYPLSKTQEQNARSPSMIDGLRALRAGDPRFELGQSESESLVLPLHQSPKRCAAHDSRSTCARQSVPPRWCSLTRSQRRRRDDPRNPQSPRSANALGVGIASAPILSEAFCRPAAGNHRDCSGRRGSAFFNGFRQPHTRAPGCEKFSMARHTKSKRG